VYFWRKTSHENISHFFPPYPFPFFSWANDPKIAQFEKAPLPSFNPPSIQTHTFSNGMKLYFLENQELPIFQLSALVQVGFVEEPQAKKGITSLMMGSLRTGGSQTLTGEEVDQKLEKKAMTLTVDSDPEYSELEIHSLVKESSEAIALFFDLLKKPRFDSEKIEINRKQMLDEISRRNEEPMEIARREYGEQLYGSENIWARVATKDSVSAITREDILNHYQQYVVPNHVWLAASGHIEFKKLVFLLEEQMKDWPQRQANMPDIPVMTKAWTPTVQVINRPTNQSSIVMGHFGERRWNDDKYALTLANYILGGSTFGSRLGTQIRTNLGLAYSVSSSFTFGTDYGQFAVAASTKTASTLQVVAETKKIIKDIIDQHPVTQQELDDAKQTMLNQLIFEYDNPFKIVEARRYYDFYGYPPDYLKVYQEKLKAVTLDQVNKVLAQYFYPDKLVIMIVGNKNEMGDLSSLGEITERPLDND
jgi:zinc protease